MDDAAQPKQGSWGMSLVWAHGSDSGWVQRLSPSSLERGPVQSGAIQEQRKIWGFPPPAQSGLRVLVLSQAGPGTGGVGTQAPTQCHRVPQNQGAAHQWDPEPFPSQATELCRPACRGLSIPSSLTLETSPSPVAWSGGGLRGYGGLCGAFGSWRRAAHAHGGRPFPDTPLSGSIRRHPAATTASPRFELPTATVSKTGTGMPQARERGRGGRGSCWLSPPGTPPGSGPSPGLLFASPPLAGCPQDWG